MAVSWCAGAACGLGGAVAVMASGAFFEEPKETLEYRSFELDALLRERETRAEGPWLEFLRVPALSCGVYVLPKDGVDRQGAHEEDEIYHVLAGRAALTVGTDEIAVSPGSVVYVRRGIDHRFHSIEEELRVLVFFAKSPPAEEEAPGDGG